MKMRLIVALLVLPILINLCLALEIQEKASIRAEGDEYWDNSLETMSGGRALVYKSNGTDLYLGSTFTRNNYYPNNPNRICKLEGTEWMEVGLGVGELGKSWSKGVNAICFKDYEVYVTGLFHIAGYVDAEMVANWDGTEWSALGAGLDGEGRAIAALGNDIYVGGDFTSAGGVSAKYIARWDGTEWYALPGELDGVVYALASYDNVLYVGGDFIKIDNVEYNGIAMWDGNNWYDIGGGIRGYVKAIAVADHGLYIGGNFFKREGIYNINSIARWDGQDWYDMAGGLIEDVYAITIDGNHVYVGGYFEYLSGVDHPANSLGKWDGEKWTTLGSGVYGWWEDPIGKVYALASHKGFVYIGGNFNSVANGGGPNIARWRIPNLPPVVYPDSVQTVEDTEVGIHVLNNDHDPEGHAFFIQSVNTDESTGSVTINPGDTTVTYTPLSGYTGTDIFYYIVNDNHFDGIDSASVFVEVFSNNQPPVAQNDSVRIEQNTSVTIPVLRNDTDPDSDPLIIQSVITAATQGTVQINAGDTTITYTSSSDFSGADQFSYTISDPEGSIDSAAVIIEVYVNQPPVAHNDTLSIQQDSVVTIYPLMNDTDPEGDPLSIAQIGDIGASGTLIINSGDTSITFIPATGFSGEVGFYYVVTDGNGGQDVALVTITVMPISAVQDPDVPKSFALFQNYPNPFNPVTTISYELPERSRVILRIFSITGSEIRTLIDEEKSAGSYKAVWDARDRFGRAVGSGIYFYQLKAVSFTERRKMLLVR